MQSSDNEESAWLTNHEEEFLQNVDDDYEITRTRLDKEKEQSIKNIWTYFQDSAQYITQLYKGECFRKVFWEIRARDRDEI